MKVAVAISTVGSSILAMFMQVTPMPESSSMVHFWSQYGAMGIFAGCMTTFCWWLLRDVKEMRKEYNTNLQKQQQEWLERYEKVVAANTEAMSKLADSREQCAVASGQLIEYVKATGHKR